jgi:hypothetical protein
VNYTELEKLISERIQAERNPWHRRLRARLSVEYQQYANHGLTGSTAECQAAINACITEFQDRAVQIKGIMVKAYRAGGFFARRRLRSRIEDESKKLLTEQARLIGGCVEPKIQEVIKNLNPPEEVKRSLDVNALLEPEIQKSTNDIKLAVEEAAARKRDELLRMMLDLCRVFK